MRERTQINKLRNEKGEVTMDTAEIQSILRDYCKQLYANKVDNLEEMPHKRDSNYHKGATLSLSPPMCLSTCTVLFFLLINTLLVSLLSVFVGVLFCKAKGPGPCCWPLVPGDLVARIQCSHGRDPTSISGWEPKSCFKLLQPKAA